MNEEKQLKPGSEEYWESLGLGFNGREAVINSDYPEQGDLIITVLKERYIHQDWMPSPVIARRIYRKFSPPQEAYPI